MKDKTKTKREIELLRIMCKLYCENGLSAKETARKIKKLKEKKKWTKCLKNCVR